MLAAAYAERVISQAPFAGKKKALDMNIGDEALQRTARPMLEQFQAGKAYRLRVKKSTSERKPLS